MDTMSGRPLLVGVDGSDPALDAVRWAARESVYRRKRLRLVAAVPWTIFQPIGLPALGQEHGREVAVRLATQHLTTAADEAGRALDPELVEYEVRGGSAAEVLHDESSRAGLLVVGGRGRGGFTGLLAGSVSTTLAATSACPVVVHRGTSAPEGPIVVGVDGSADGEAALGFAFEEARLRHAPLVAVRAWSDEVFDPVVAILLDREGIARREQAVIDEALAPWQQKYPDVRARSSLTLDRAAAALVDESGGAQLVVVGSRGHGTLASALLGSVSRTVVNHARCPVAVVRRDGAAVGEP